jgi:hypothetical protein
MINPCFVFKNYERIARVEISNRKVNVHTGIYQDGGISDNVAFSPRINTEQHMKLKGKIGLIIAIAIIFVVLDAAVIAYMYFQK